MRIDTTRSKYQERKSAVEDFDRDEIKHLRMALRRLRFLETKIRDAGGQLDASGGAIFDEKEADALAFILTEIDFLAPIVETEGPLSVSLNRMEREA